MRRDAASKTPARTVIVVALTRMGDIYELYPMVVALTERHPACRVYLVAYREFCHALGPLVRFAGIFPVDGPDLRSRLRSGENPLSVYRSIDGLIGALNELDGDLLVNLTPNRIGAIMGYMIKTREKKGLHMTPDGFRAHYSPWIAYLSTLVRNRIYNSLNLSDLFLKIGGVDRDWEIDGLRIPERARKSVRSLLEEAGVRKNGRIVAIATGASAELKRWSPEDFAELTRLILSQEKDVHAVLLGAGPKDTERNLRVRDLLSKGSPELAVRLHDWTGRTDVDELFALLEAACLLISNDTGTMHAAALLRTPVVCLSFANLFYPETGPASPGNIVIHSLAPCAPCATDSRCNHPVCRKDLEPAAVARVVIRRMAYPKILDQDGIKDLARSLSGFLPIGRADIAICIRDAMGDLRFRSLGPYEHTPEAFFRRVYERLWREEFEGKEDTSPCDIPCPREANEAIGCGVRIEDLAIEALQAVSDVRTCLGKDQNGGQVPEDVLCRFERIDRSLEEAAWSCPPVGPLVVFFQMEKESIDIWDPSELNELVGRTEETYRSLLRRVRLFMAVIREFGSRRLNETPDRGDCILAVPVA